MHDLKKLQSFHKSCFRKIVHISWPRKISNNELFKLTEQENIGIVLTRKRSKLALSWTSEGKRKRGCLKSTWRRTAEAELMSLNLKWGQAPRLALERQEWKKPDDALCTP